MNLNMCVWVLTKTALWEGIGGPLLPGVTVISVWVCSLNASTKLSRKATWCLCSFIWSNCCVYHLLNAERDCAPQIIISHFDFTFDWNTCRNYMNKEIRGAEEKRACLTRIMVRWRRRGIGIIHCFIRFKLVHHVENAPGSFITGPTYGIPRWP